MNNCNQGCGCDHGAGVIAGPCTSRNCGKSNENLRIKTVVLQPSLGTDEKGQPYAPKLGAYINTIVTYQANGALYLYDSRGIFTKVTSDSTAEALATEITNRIAQGEQLNEAIVKTAEMLQTNINVEVNAREQDRDNLQENINRNSNSIDELEQSSQEFVASYNKTMEGVQHDLENLTKLVHDQDVDIRASYTSDTVDLTTNSDGATTTSLTAARSNTDTKGGSAGIMTAFQATQLNALANAYEAEEKGKTLYEDTASTNNVELSEAATSFDHIVVTGEYMGEGSFALQQAASVTYYPMGGATAFQMNAIDITTGNAPSVEIVQDIWSVTNDGMGLELASSVKAMVNSETTVTPSMTSNFTITKVVGFGKKLAGSQ